MQYERFVDALLAAEAVPAHIPEDNARFFEACLPIEELARRGRETLRFGPMKPMGLMDPRTGRRPYAVVQLRQENLRADSYNLVGFQNHMRFPEQARVFRMIPGLERAEFLRYGQIHRNTYINGPALLTATLQLRTHPRVFFAGQISGVEGYVESIATGLVAGRHAVELAAGAEIRPFPRETAIGSLCAYVSGADRSQLPAGQHHVRFASCAGRSQHGSGFATTRKRATPKFAGGPSRSWTNIDRYMSELSHV